MDEELNSVTLWLEQLKKNDEQAAVFLWDRYFGPLINRARFRLGSHRGRAGAEDAVLDVLNSVFLRARAGKYPDLQNRDDLWRLLLTITDRKCSNLIRDERTKKRGGGNVRGDSIFSGDADDERGGGFDVFEGFSLTPDAAVAISETLSHLLTILAERDSELVQIAILRMEGWKNHEIAEKIGKALATVERRLQMIRELWKAWDPRT